MRECAPSASEESALLVSEELLRDQLAAMHLQWFAAEEEGRTEDPTEQKIRKSREEGKVAKSPDVSSAVVMLFSVVALGLLGTYMLELILEMTRFYLARAGELDPGESGLLMRAFYGFFPRIILPLALVSFVAAIFGNVVQFGFLFTTKPISPDINRVAPNVGKWAKRSFLSVEALYNFMRNIGKVILIGTVSYLLVRSRFDMLTSMIRLPYQQSFAFVAQTVFILLLTASLLLLFISLFDYAFQRQQHREQLKMTKQEVKEERKQFEGDPQVKNRMRQRMQDLLSRNMVQNVQTADVVVTNPTHFAVAIRYDPATMSAPTVTAKGQDEAALRIRRIAQEAGVPMIENKPLARAVYAEVEIGDEIPEKYFEAMVIVLREVYRMTGKKVMYG
ncbi:flagellar biosynthetic protein FlhB [Alkalispirochaeta americana]|uniref:Flagellar biosynthetic protein FlhB n=1 Tax=Alkalispirochaeta americana TaxID=159291 RepID=A0A1N6PN10_9SPIO|nr:flagellar biosynthesis protein FlhB [Alkalispirochaeta americana]SIQ05542.1 flagellar biosynthetic protein FlhB [Alkalispirochaeta americana]